ncbi:DUF421 domain-containing protein [Apilactobacillus xinyiensis]|uniref:DUF421 domain-containing protein n=1 Tax=Apilactobacillus xinyiensis TaxID=2841032 RepID=A0ABT0I2K3_9LACO|nr:YetF domain-containing protein [Apilactobacillus xinyiensis]MCK8624934.1 DUF421 domain-containing protein [Apilactobacillus xinyiensis]MCL0312602.1 DUF421 domain-containing protein [Apilactobacillus xinyiensis]MCL0318997.1 DUF421 domain-containing protein [Apilactobacillus xinyiensis]MCL0330231.1 DUF421 domain-containing protein [Apilactobacillus xinyiensis]
MEHYYLVVIKMILAIILLLIYSRVSTSRSIAPATPTDQISNMVVGAIVGGNVLSPDVSILESVLTMGLWTILLLVIRLLKKSNPKIKQSIDGSDLVLMSDGKFDVDKFEEAKMPMDQLMHSIHLQGINSLEQIDEIILTAGGSLIVNTKKDKDNSLLVISRGDILEDHLEKAGKDRNWLNQKLQEHNVKNVEDVYMCEYFDNDINLVMK